MLSIHPSWKDQSNLGGKWLRPISWPTCGCRGGFSCIWHIEENFNNLINTYFAFILTDDDKCASGYLSLSLLQLHSHPAPLLLLILIRREEVQLSWLQFNVLQALCHFFRLCCCFRPDCLTHTLRAGPCICFAHNKRQETLPLKAIALPVKESTPSQVEPCYADHQRFITSHQEKIQLLTFSFEKKQAVNFRTKKWNKKQQHLKKKKNNYFSLEAHSKRSFSVLGLNLIFPPFVLLLFPRLFVKMNSNSN